MTTEIKVLNSSFDSKGSMKTDVSLSPEDINIPVVHQVVKAILAGRRQGTACTKTKAMVSGGGIKPFKQKGTGRARQGSTRSPLMVGGGTAFGPTPRSYEQKVNKRVMRKAIQSVLADKLNEGKLLVLEEIKSSGKTSELFKVLSERNLFPVLLVTDNKDSLAIRAAKNLKRGIALPVDGFSVYEAVKYENLVIEKSALERLLNKIG